MDSAPPAMLVDLKVVESLRERVRAAITTFEDKEQELRLLVIATRRELRETLQAIDVLINENARLTAAVAEKDLLIAQQASQIQRLRGDVERLEAERLALIPRPGG